MTDQENSTDTAAAETSAAAPATPAAAPAAPAPAPAIDIHQHKEGFRAILMDDALEVEEAFEKAWKWLISAATPAPATDTKAA